ncbi:MAG TPA: HAD family hydrolase [Sedimentisphaerales bacterium]|nr:HAD family hydrolase [Sedimentisphaerales bacterium]HRS12519.1 HAD family hydrolase [Sedimentisphaerales bacterium]HRV49157.1 HAD family hydrolase [Sedimentisphaerales bacterium]
MAVEAPTIRPVGLDPVHPRRQEAIPPAALRLWQGRAFFSMAALYLFYYFGKKNRPCVTEAVEELRQRRIPVAVNAGYNREMLEIVLARAAEGGFVPDAAACAADVPKGRPALWMVFRLMETLNAYPPAAVVKVGDTVADVEEGLNAGVRTVGITRTGNLIGLTQTSARPLWWPSPPRKPRAEQNRLYLIQR